MTTRQKVIITIHAMMLFCVFSTYSFAEDFSIDGYSVIMNVNSDNIYDITEDIKVNFEAEKMGFSRKIKVDNKIERSDGTISDVKAIVSNIETNGKTSVSDEAGYKIIKIFDVDGVVKGLRQYTFKYSYVLGEDTTREYDEVFYNIIGGEWETAISGIKFEINMPKEFDKRKVDVVAGSKDSDRNNSVNYNVIDKKIVGDFSGTLNPYEALTVRILLPEGYFEKSPLELGDPLPVAEEPLDKPSNLMQIVIIVGIVIAIVVIILSVLYFRKRNQKITW